MNYIMVSSAMIRSSRQVSSAPRSSGCFQKVRRYISHRFELDPPLIAPNLTLAYTAYMRLYVLDRFDTRLTFFQEISYMRDSSVDAFER